MADNKKYYYLKLKDNFYNTEDIKLLESMPNGYEYSSLYLKLCLLSLKGEGKLLYKNRIPYKPEMLSSITGHSIEVIKYAIDIFSRLEMLIILDNGTIFIDDMQNLVGHGSSEAERKATYRKKIDSEKQMGHCPDNRPPEKELELELEKEIELEKESIKKEYMFNQLWNLYDKKVGKESAIKSFKHIKKNEYDLILKHIPKYIESQPDKQYRKNLSTYLNQKSWQDEIIKKVCKTFADIEEQNRAEVLKHIKKRLG